MGYQATFKRYENKYLLTKAEKDEIMRLMEKHMKIDHYGRTTIRNIYFDTDNYRIIRRSIEKPIYKEKLRIRSYKKADSSDTVFVELKKKYKSIVYKRRIAVLEDQAMQSFQNDLPLPFDGQIADEIEYFRSYYEKLYPKVFISYEREAYYAINGEDFRITFDENILYRQDDVSLKSDIYGIPLLDQQQTLMEIKTSGGIPLWMSHVLNRYKIYKISYSKYGQAYCHILEQKGGSIC